MRVLILLILIICSGTVSAQRKNPVEETPPIERPMKLDHKDLARSLCAPAAYDRVRATFDMNALGLFDEEYLKFLHKHHTEVFLDVLYRIWPEDADKFVDTLYEMKDEDETTIWEEIAADILFRNDKLDRIEEDLDVAIQLKKLWYNSWKTRIPRSIIWPELYRSIARKVWLYDMFVADTGIATAVRSVARFFAFEYNEVEDAAGWRRMLWDARENNTCPTSGLYYIDDGTVGNVDAAVVICILLNRIDWLIKVKKEIDKVIEDHGNWMFRQPWGFQTRRWNYKVDVFLKRDSKLGEIKELLDDSSIDDRVLLHNSWFESTRKKDGFKEWWEENFHQHTYKEPDPLFSNTNWDALTD